MQQTHTRYSNAKLLSYLKSNYLFEKFSDSILQDVIADMEWTCLGKDEILFRQGDAGDFLYLVFRGHLQVTINGKGGAEVPVSEIGPDTILGEIQLLTGGTRTANVYALQETELLKLSKTAFERLADKNPELVEQMAAIVRRRLRRDQLVTILPNLFGPLETTMLKNIETEITWFSLAQGETLFEEGDAGDSFFLVISGRLQALVRNKSGDSHVIGEIRRGEIVGEMAMFTGESRSASIAAIRHSELVKFSRQAFERIIAMYPTAMMRMVRTIITRLQNTNASSQATPAVMNIAVVPADQDVPLNDFTNRLIDALSAFGKTLYLSSSRLNKLLGTPGAAQTPEDAPNNIRLAAWLDERETQYRVVIYETDVSSSPWTKRCIQRADQILIVAQANANPTPGDIETTLLGPGKSVTQANRTLILLHPDGKSLPTNTQEWLSVRQIGDHHHLRWDTDADFGRLARFLSGRAVGLVLGGGGARGYAHIGVIRALKEAGVAIDMIGGASIGATISAQYAMGLDYDHILQLNRKIWVDSKPFNDYTLPLMSLIKGRKFETIAKLVYGNTRIEDLWINFFCVSTNLTTTELVVHREGPLSKALRATASLPGIAVPLVEGTNLLVDGGVLNNLPVDVMRKLCGGTVIAINVSPEKDLSVDYDQFPSPWEFLWGRIAPFHKAVNVPNIVDILMRTTMVSSIHRAHTLKMETDLYFEPPLNQFKLLDFKALDEIVDVGYRYAQEKIDELQKNETFKNIFE